MRLKEQQREEEEESNISPPSSLINSVYFCHTCVLVLEEQTRLASPTQPDRERDAISPLILLIPQHFLRLSPPPPFSTFSHYNFFTGGSLSLLLPSSPSSLCLPAVGALYLCLSSFFFSSSPLLDNPSSSGGPLSHPSPPPPFVYWDTPLHLLIPYFPSCPPVSVLIRLVVSHFHPLCFLLPIYIYFLPRLSSLHLLSLPPHLFPVLNIFFFHGSGNDGSHGRNTHGRS